LLAGPTDVLAQNASGSARPAVNNSSRPNALTPPAGAAGPPSGVAAPAGPTPPPANAAAPPAGGAAPPASAGNSAAPSNPSAGNNVLRSFNVGNWIAAAFAVPGTNNFDHCGAAASYQSGITIGFAVNGKFQWNLNLYDPNWKLASGTSYPVVLAIDSSSPDFVTASAISTTEVQIPLALSVALFKRFMNGETLKVEAASAIYSFNLTKTSELLPTLLKCVEAYAGAAPVNANPFVAN
jgi:hypothetical protein